jgi:hypothetical protein
MSTKSFDLNIEEVLENWEVEHALREVISNALDEQVISKTLEIEIGRDSKGDWCIRDFGRGLKIEHFTLNENQEKLNAPSGVIGKFGVGLKDALATFYRRGIGVRIYSSFGTFSLKQEHKHGFDDIVTLHVEYDDMPNKIDGTEFILQGVTETDMAKAKSLFMKFSDENVLEANSFGQILERKDEIGRVYILGVLASAEPNFLFSYNITSLTDAMKKKLNRERLNVGRSTYTERVKAILKNAKNPLVENLLVEQVEKRATGEQCDEMAWIEISQMALNLMHSRERVAYLTEKELQTMPSILDNIKSDGYKVVVVTEQQKDKLNIQAETGGPEVRTLENYVEEFNSSFEYKFVDINHLTKAERQVYDLTPKILSLVGLNLRDIPPINISETIRTVSVYDLLSEATGVWDRSIPAIVIKRNRLNSAINYSSTLLHEVAHATTNTGDATREFESVLTGYLGKTSIAAIRK